MVKKHGYMHKIEKKRVDTETILDISQIESNRLIINEINTTELIWFSDDTLDFKLIYLTAKNKLIFRTFKSSRSKFEYCVEYDSASSLNTILTLFQKILYIIKDNLKILHDLRISNKKDQLENDLRNHIVKFEPITLVILKIISYFQSINPMLEMSYVFIWNLLMALKIDFPLSDQFHFIHDNNYFELNSILSKYDEILNKILNNQINFMEHNMVIIKFLTRDVIINTITLIYPTLTTIEKEYMHLEQDSITTYKQYSVMSFLNDYNDTSLNNLLELKD